MGLFLRHSHFHAGGICVWTALISALTTQSHSLPCSFHGVCILVTSARLCILSVSLCDGRPATTVFSSQCQPSLSLRHTGPIYNTSDTMITSLAARSFSRFNRQTYQKASHSLRVCLLCQLANIDRSKLGLQC